MQFAVGDSVLLSTQNLRLKGILHKLQQKFCSPYKVVEKIGTQAYRLKLPDTWRIHPVFHVPLLKPWRPSIIQQVPGEVELEDADQPQYFDVEKILWWRWNSKTQRRQREFLVLCRDVPSGKNPSTGTTQQRLFLVLKVVLHAVVVISEVLRLSTKSRCSRCCRHISSPMAGVSNGGCRMDPRILF